MSIRILFSTMRRRPMMPLLVLLQVAVACAILCNVLFLTWRQLAPMLAPSGIDGDNLILVDQLSPAHDEWPAAQVRAGAEAMREVPGVRSVSAAIGLPLMVGGMLNIARLQAHSGAKVNVTVYAGHDLAQTLGVQLVKGRYFLPDEYRVWGSGQGKGTLEPIIITESLAHRLFGEGNALGRVLRNPGDRTGGGYQVVGIVNHLLTAFARGATPATVDNTILKPESVGKTPYLSYAVRVDPGMRAEALRGVRRAIARKFGPLLAVGSKGRARFYNTIRNGFFSSSRAALWLLASVSVVVLVVTMIGIMGLTGFWIQRRTRSIGIRRALGARRVDILKYFQAENALVVAIGIVAGMLLAYFGNALLMRYYELPRLPLWYLPVGAVVMLVLGQLAVLAPALRAAAVPPVVATRSI
ncbi:MAG: ABC transporter permease [Rhodanobacteraceae bacterium]